MTGYIYFRIQNRTLSVFPIVFVGHSWNYYSNGTFQSKRPDTGERVHQSIVASHCVPVSRSSDAMAWNLAMKSRVDSGLWLEALTLYKQMVRLRVNHDEFTFPVVNRALLSLEDGPVYGEMVHCVATKTGFGSDLYFCNTIIVLYSKLGFVGYACRVFEQMPVRDLVSWTSMISGFASNGDVAAGFQQFAAMRREMQPNSVTFIALVRGCLTCENLVGAKQLHCLVIKYGLLDDDSVRNSILNVYCKIGCSDEVENLMAGADERDVVCWNILIELYRSVGDYNKVLCCFSQMRREGLVSCETLTLLLLMLAVSGYPREGEKLHCLSVKTGLFDDIFLTSLLHFYAKSGELGSSVRIFREITSRSTITWNVMMKGFIQQGNLVEAVSLFRELQDCGVEPGAEILVSLVDACSYMGFLQYGKETHNYMIRHLFGLPEEDIMRLETSVLNMYIKCGSVYAARRCFDQMRIKDVVTWTSMIEGYGIYGCGIEALQLFHDMLEQGILPNGVTFLSLLSGCSHSGLLKEGCELFHVMKWIHGVEPELAHYTSMVDLLGRSGKLKDSLALILKMDVDADSRIWGALLAACRVHGDSKIGEFAAHRLQELESDNAGYYTVFGNMQSGAGQWDRAEGVRRVVREKDLRRSPGWSYLSTQ